MGILLSVVISYAGVQEAVECIKHILSGMLPDTDPDFQELVDYYTRLLQKSSSQSNPHASVDWTKECGQGYLCLTEDINGKLKSASVKYYDGQPNSTAILFSTKISSFGQESVDDSSQPNGDYRTERYTPSKTKTIISNTSESFSIGYRNRSPTSENVSDPPLSANSFEHEDREEEDTNDASGKLTWHYRPKSPIQPQPTLPEIQFQTFDEDKRGVSVYSEEFLRLLFIDIGYASCIAPLPSSDIATPILSDGTIINARVESYFRSWFCFTCIITDSSVVNLFKIT